MQLSPRYDGPAAYQLAPGTPNPLDEVARQRRRFEQLLGELDAADWDRPSRCDGWRVRDVVSHLVTVNEFWALSVNAGVAGAPTRFLGAFDPVATPQALVDGIASLGSDEVYDRFVATNDAFVATLTGLSDEQWDAVAESPGGHLAVRVLAQHALWDSWVHERDVALPLGIEPEVNADELAVALRFAAALGPVLGLGLGTTTRAGLVVQATEPELSFSLSVADEVRSIDGVADPAWPVLRGPAVELTEALSMRGPLPADAPPEWIAARSNLEQAFDQR